MLPRVPKRNWSGREVPLARRGLLFLDELPEFNRQALEALRQPLEIGRAAVAPANAQVT